MVKQKRWIALIVALCTVIGLCVPLSGPVRAAGYTFSEYYTENLGIALKSDMSMNNFFEIVTYDGNDYVVVPAKGGHMFIFDLTAFINGTPNADGNYLYADIKSDIGSPRGLLQVGSIVYSVGDASHVTWYDFSTGNSGNITTPGAAYGLTADESGNVFVCGASGTVSRIDAGTTTATTIYTTKRITKILSIAYYNSKLYIQGTLKSTYGDGSEVHEIGTQKSDNGSGLIGDWFWTYSPKRTLTLSGVAASYYMSCVSGMLFFGNVGSIVAVDTTATNMTRYYGRLNADNSVSLVTALADDETEAPQILGIMPTDTNGYSYAVISGIALYTYNTTNKIFVVKQAGGAKSRDLRCRDTYTVNGSEFIPTGNGSTMSIWKISGANNFPVSLDGIFKGGYSEASMRTMAPGVAGSDTVMYAGGYLSPDVAGYAPYSTGLTNSVFSNGHAQTDSMLPYGDKLYAGCYSGAYLVEYDPATGTVTELIDGGVSGMEDVTPNQIRIHALAAGDGKIFFSTIPDDQEVGGWLGCYDIAAKTYTMLSHADGGFTDQTIITLAYDEENNILYAGSSVRGGTAAEIAEDAEAKLHAFSFNDSTNQLTHLAGVTVGNLTPGSDTPLFVGGIAKDPQSNTFWGKVSQTLFTFKYENGALTTTHQWSASTYASSNTDRYTDSGSVSWFPRPILFDDNHLYVVMDQSAYGLSRFDLNTDRTAISNQTKISDHLSRIYTMGTDYNIYIANGFTIDRIVISRTTMLEQLIDSYTADATDMETVIAAYHVLTEKEQSRLSSRHAAIMNQLLDAECYYYDNSGKVITTLEKAMENAGSGNSVYLLADYEGTVTVKNGVVLDLDGKNIKGDVHVLNGELADSTSSGTVTGDLTIPSDNPQIPLLVPGTQNSYRFFEYWTVQATKAKADDTLHRTENFWFDMEFVSSQAYTLLKGDSNLKVSATLSWTEESGVQSVEVSFDEVLKNWAAADHSQNQGLYVQVTNIPPMGVSDITVTPRFELVGTDIVIELDPVTCDVTQFAANAIVGAYPSDLITQ